MTNPDTPSPADNDKLRGLLTKLDDAIASLGESREFAKPAKLPRVIDTCRRVLMQPGGCAEIEQRAETLEQAGLDVVVLVFLCLQQVAQGMGVVALEVDQAPVGTEGGTLGDGLFQRRGQLV